MVYRDLEPGLREPGDGAVADVAYSAQASGHADSKLVRDGNSGIRILGNAVPDAPRTAFGGPPGVAATRF